MDTFEIVFPLTALAVLAIVISASMEFGNWFLNRNRVTYRSKDEPFECGINQTYGTAEQPIDVKFYLVAMLFLAFDIEIAFLYPWAVCFLQGGWEMLWAFIPFLLLLEAAYLYLFRKGALDWHH